MAETVTVLSVESTSFFTAVTVTVPLLDVSPATMVSVLFAVTAMSFCSTAVAETVRVTAWLDLPLSCAVMLVEPAFSEIVLSLSAITRETTGNASSSSRVRVTSAGFVIVSTLLFTVPEMVTVLSGESTSLSTAAMVTLLPVLVSALGAMVRVVPVCLKSAASAFVPAAADTVTVVSAVDGRFNVAVMVVWPRFSEMELSASTMVSSTTRGLSLSMMVPVPVSVVPPPVNAAFERLLSLTLIVSLDSTAVSSAMVIAGIFLLVSPGANVSVPEVNAV